MEKFLPEPMYEITFCRPHDNSPSSYGPMEHFWAIKFWELMSHPLRETASIHELFTEKDYIKAKERWLASHDNKGEI